MRDFFLEYAVALSSRTHIEVTPLDQIDLIAKLLQARVGQHFFPGHAANLPNVQRMGKPVHFTGWYSCNGFTPMPLAWSERMPLTLAAAALSVVMIGMR